MALLIKKGIGTTSRPRPSSSTAKPLIPVAPSTGSTVYPGMVPVGWAGLIADDNPALAVLTELGDQAPRPTQGYGGWEETERRGRESLTDWTGFKAMGWELDLEFDDLDANRSVEPAIEVLEALAGRGRRRTGGRPPLLIVDTAGVMRHDARAFPDTRWVINDLDFDEEATIVNDAGDRVRVDVTITLLRYVCDDRLQDRALAARRRNQAKTKSATKRYTVKAGDTLQSIARKKLGDAGRWQEIQKLNPGLRDPRAIKANTTIRLP